MYGKFGKIDPPKKPWPSERAKALRHIVDEKTASVYNDSEALRACLIKANLKFVEVKQLELALTSQTLIKLLCSENLNPTSIDINNALFSIESCGIADDDARDILEDLLYSINVDSVLRDYSAVKAAHESNAAAIYIPPYVYREKLDEIMELVSERNSEALTDEMLEELNVLAECNVGQANFILAYMYYEGTGVDFDTKLSKDYAKKAAACGYPPAYALLGDTEYDNHHYDEAYAYYTKPGAVALDARRITRLDKLFKAKGFAKKVCVSLGILYAIIVAVMILAVNSLSLAGRSPVALTIFIVLMTIMMAYIVYVHFRKPLKDLRHWALAFALLFTLYLVFALV